MNAVIISAEILEGLLQLFLKAKHKDLWPEEVHQYVNQVKQSIKPYIQPEIPKPAETKNEAT